MIEKVKLGTKVEFQRGYDLTHEQMRGGKYPVVGSTSIIGYHDEYKSDGGIVIGRSGTVGQPQLITCCFWPHNTSLFTTDIKGNSLEYLYYALINLNIGKMKTGSNIPTLNRNDLYPLEIPFETDVNQQKLVANVLSTLDAKITLNNSICSDLEAMAKLLYDYWFVQFDFPDENGKPYKSSGGKMVWNEELKREIPEGWEVKAVNTIIGQLSGFPFSSDDYVKKGKFKLYTIKNVQDGHIVCDVDNCLNFIPDKMDSGCLLTVGDMIMSLTGNVGRVGIVYENNALLNQRVLKLRPLIPSKMFVRQFMNSSEMRSRIDMIAVGTSQKNLSPIEFGELLVLVPRLDVIKLYGDKCDGIYDIVVSKLQENQELTSLRDFLLPMLMNGQVKVKAE